MVCCLAALALFATLAHAEDYLSPTEERVRLSLGVVRSRTIPIFSSTAVRAFRARRSMRRMHFGLDKKRLSKPRFQAMVRVGERHRLRFDYFSLDRTVRPPSTEPIVFRDVVLQPGDPLDIDLSIRTFSISYGYSFLHGDKYEVAATIGIN